MRKPRITFCRMPARIMRGTRGWHIKVDGKRVGSVDRRAHTIEDRWCKESDRVWYWTSRVNDVVLNSLVEQLPTTTADEAKAAAKAWILKQLEVNP